MRLCKEMKVNLNQAILSHEDSSLRTEDNHGYSSQRSRCEYKREEFKLISYCGRRSEDFSCGGMNSLEASTSLHLLLTGHVGSAALKTANICLCIWPLPVSYKSVDTLHKTWHTSVRANDVCGNVLLDLCKRWELVTWSECLRGNNFCNPQDSCWFNWADLSYKTTSTQVPCLDCHHLMCVGTFSGRCSRVPWAWSRLRWCLPGRPRTLQWWPWRGLWCLARQGSEGEAHQAAARDWTKVQPEMRQWVEMGWGEMAQQYGLHGKMTHRDWMGLTRTEGSALSWSTPYQ